MKKEAGEANNMGKKERLGEKRGKERKATEKEKRRRNKSEKEDEDENERGQKGGREGEKRV